MGSPTGVLMISSIYWRRGLKCLDVDRTDLEEAPALSLCSSIE
jgi:hypothetical protein